MFDPKNRELEELKINNKLLKSIDKNLRFFVYLTAISLVIGGIAVITILCKPFFEQFQ